MSFWSGAKVALNSTIGTSRFKAIDQVISEERYNLMQLYSKADGTYNNTWFFVPKGVKEINITDFYLNSSSLATVVFLPFSAESIADGCFYNFNKLKEIVIPENGKFEMIGQDAFSNCESLEQIEFPSTLTYIAENCFSGCSMLKTIIFQNTINEWENRSLVGGFGEGVTDFKVFCTDGYLEYTDYEDTEPTTNYY